MYTISEASHRSGVAIATIRAWERRYRVVAPARTASGYRLYDDAAIDRLAEMRSLVASGWQPSVAAVAILGRATTTPVSRRGPDGASPAPDVSESQRITDRLLRSAAAVDDVAVDAVLDDLFSRGSFERVAADLLFPALRALGEAWARGDVNVAGEHVTANAVHRRLGLALEAAGRVEDPAGRIIVGLPPGGRHELGALAFTVAARRAGLPVAYLGPDLPVDDWVAAAEGALAAVIGVVTPRDRGPATQVARRLRSSRPDLVIAFGGRSAPGLGDTVRLPEDLSDAVAALDEEIDGRARPHPPADPSYSAS